MEPENEKRIDTILNSLSGMQRAEPSPFLYARIRNRLSAGATPFVTRRGVWLAAASLVLLGLLNWRVLHQPTPAPNPGDLGVVVTDMQLYPTANQPYARWNERNY